MSNEADPAASDVVPIEFGFSAELFAVAVLSGSKPVKPVDPGTTICESLEKRSLIDILYRGKDLISDA